MTLGTILQWNLMLKKSYTLSISTLQNDKKAVCFHPQWKYETFLYLFQIFSNIHIFMNNSQDQMRCLWTTQEDICIYTEDYLSPLDILPLKKYHNGRRTNPNKYIIIVRRSFSTGVAVYLLQQTKYLVI